MGTLKMFLSTWLVASAMVLSEEQEWRLFGGLLAGGVIGGMCGMLLAAISGPRPPWQIYAFRFAANVLGSLGLGAMGLVVSVGWFSAHPGPLLTVAHGFAFGLIGVGAFVKTLEGPLLKRLARLAGGEGSPPQTQQQDVDRYLPQPPTQVKVVNPPGAPVPVTQNPPTANLTQQKP